MSRDGTFFEAFCYLGLTKFPEQLESTLTVLPDTQREEALAIFASVKDLSKVEWLRRWSRLRAEEYAGRLEPVERRSGIDIDELPPSLREQWLDWLTEQDD